MGRGRAKAKHTKVARRLKYYSPETDLRSLERELSVNKTNGDQWSQDDVDDEDDDYGEWASGQR